MALDVGESSAEGSGEVVGIGECGVGHRPAPQQRPDALHRIQVRAVGGKLDDGEPFVVGRVLPHSGGTMGVQIVPDGNDRGAELQVRADHEVSVVLPGEALACAFEEQVEAGPVDHPGPFPGPVAAQCGDRDPSPGPSPHSHYGSLPASSPRAGLWRRHREPGLVLEDDPGIERRRGASTCGHTSFFQSPTACSSRSSARRAGLCQDQPWRCRSRHTPAIEQLTLNSQPISVLTRSSVHR